MTQQHLSDSDRLDRNRAALDAQPVDFKTALLRDVLDWMNDNVPTFEMALKHCELQCDVGTSLKARIEAALIEEPVPVNYAFESDVEEAMNRR